MKHSILIGILILRLLFINTAIGTPKAFFIGNPFKAALDALSNRAKDLLDRATKNGLILETSGSEQLINIIANVQAAYENELSATSHVMSNKEQSILSGISTILDQIQNHTIENISASITQFALLIPKVGDHPQLTSWAGNTIIPNQTNVSIKLYGIFKFASNSGFEPIMKVGNKSCTPSEKKETYLSFDVPVQQMKFLSDKVNYEVATIEIPYQNHFWLPKKTKTAEYKLKLILLPLNPGKFEFFKSTTVNQTVRKNKTCDLFWSGHEDLIQYCNPDPGYTIDVASINKTLIGEGGKGFGHDHWDLGTDFTKTEVGIGFHVKSDGDDSFVAYRISYSMYKEIPVPIDISSGEEFYRWGDSKTYTIADDKSTWKAIYSQFDNRKVAFATSSESNPYIRIKQTGNQVVVSFAPFDL